MHSERVFSLRWDKFTSHVTGCLDACYEKQQFVDVSLVCRDGTILKCHKIILANASNFFSHLLVSNDHPHPMIILHDIEADDLKTIINFIYCGEIQVIESEVRRILKIAKILQINGLTDLQTKPVVLQTDPRMEVNSKVTEGVTKVHSNLPVRPIKVPLQDVNKKLPVRKIEHPLKSNNTQEGGKVLDDRRRFGMFENQTEVIRPGPSRSPHEKIVYTKKKAEPILDWNYVLKSIAKTEHEMPLKKLCIINEVEITPGKHPFDSLSKEQTFSEKRPISDPAGDFEVIVIRDDLDAVGEPHDLNI